VRSFLKAIFIKAASNRVTKIAPVKVNVQTGRPDEFAEKIAQTVAQHYFVDINA
jgi:hypothetical protein